MQTSPAVAEPNVAKYTLPFLPFNEWGAWQKSVFTKAENQALKCNHWERYKNKAVPRAEITPRLIEDIIALHKKKGCFELDKNFLNSLVPVAVTLYKSKLADAYFADKENKAPQPKPQPKPQPPSPPMSKEDADDRKAYDAYIKSFKEAPKPRVYKNNSIHDAYMRVKERNKKARTEAEKSAVQ